VKQGYHQKNKYSEQGFHQPEQEKITPPKTRALCSEQ
jgi:hypothetical protein